MRLIIYEPAFRRIEGQIAPCLAKLDLLLVDSQGQITSDDMLIDQEQAQPDAGWTGADAMGGAGGRAILISCLKSHRLSWVHTGAAGVDAPVWRQLVEKGAVLTTGHGQANSIAEYVLAETMGHFQRLAERRAEQAAHKWTRLPFREVAGTRWLLIGFGAIGQGVAQRVKGFGARVDAVRRSGAAHPLADRVIALSEVKSLLPQADVVVLSPPLNDETRGLADAGFFAAMKPRALLVNVGRGQLVDEAALIAALDKGIPEHAILDVFHAEPLPADSPFWDHPKVSLTPHASAFGNGAAARNDAMFVENLKRRLAGEPLLYEADARDLGR